MLRLIRFTVLFAIFATIPQMSSAQNVEVVDGDGARFTCPRKYEFIPVRVQEEPLHATNGDWGAGAVAIPFLNVERKKSGGIWDITCRYGSEYYQAQTQISNPPVKYALVRTVFATLVRRVSASKCYSFASQLETWCEPPIDRGLDVYQPPSPAPVDRGLDVYRPPSETPETPPPPPPPPEGSS